MAPDTAEPVRLHPAAVRFARLVEASTGGQRTGVYLVGSPAMGDFSPRQSNLDLVVVTEEPLPPGKAREMASAHRSLRLNGRDASVCYTTWDSLERPPAEAGATVYVGSAEVDPGELANPMTWAVLAASPTAVAGPARPAVVSDAAEVRSWFASRLPDVVARTGSLLWRRHLTRVVLQATRCAHGARTGEVVSLRRAGELALPGASHTGHRVITDALGYREGANTSMYWGPFERKANATTLMQDLLRTVQPAPTGS